MKSLEPIQEDSLWIKLLCRTFIKTAKHLGPRRVGELFEQLQIEAAGNDPRIGIYALECNNPQALCFLIDVYPVLQNLLARYPRQSSLRFLDIGPAFGASAGLLSQMHRSDFLGPKLEVSVLDITDERQAFIELSYPQLQFIRGPIELLDKSEQWDIVYCSNTIEHLVNPAAFIAQVLEHTKGFALFIAPHMEEEPLSLDHKSKIGEHCFKNFSLETFKVFRSAAWPQTAGGIDRKQMLAVVRGSSRAN